MPGNLDKKTTQPPSKGLLDTIVNALDTVANPVARYGGYIAAFMLAAMMFLAFVDTIFGRLGRLSLINKHTDFFGPIIGGQEIAELFMLIMIIFGLALCASKQGHIRVDLIMQYLSKKANLGFDIFTYFISFTFYLFITWQAFQYGIDNLRDKSVTTILTISNSPFNFLLAAGSALTALVFLRDAFKSIKEVAK
jgi:TRAP-type C4-dicarboxylate transport system permease small subunit